MSVIAMPRPVRRVMTILHIVSSVGLIGSAAGVGVLAATGQVAAVPTLVHLLGIPLALAGLVTGILLGLGTRWGLLRHGWVTAKLVVLVGVLAIGVLGVRPSIDAVDAGDPGALLTVSVLNAVQLTALVVATVFSVVKPRRLWPVRGRAVRRTVRGLDLRTTDPRGTTPHAADLRRTDPVRSVSS